MRAAVVFAVEAVAAVVDFAAEAEAAAFALVADTVACPAEAVAAVVVLRALPTPAVLIWAAELKPAEPEAPSLICANDWLETARAAMMMEVIAKRFIIPDLLVRK